MSRELYRIYRISVKRAVRTELIEELGVIKEDGRLLWSWAPGMRCLNNEASLTWRVIQVSKNFFSACLAISTKCVQCGDMKESIAHAFFHCLVIVQASWRLHGSCTVWKFLCPWSQFRMEQCGSITKQDGTLGIMWVEIWTTWQKRFHEDESFLAQTLVAFF